MPAKRQPETATRNGNQKRQNREKEVEEFFARGSREKIPVGQRFRSGDAYDDARDRESRSDPEASDSHRAHFFWVLLFFQGAISLWNPRWLRTAEHTYNVCFRSIYL